MRITNILNLPQALVDCCSTSPHNAEGSLSATTLEKGVKEIILSKRHWDELEDDASNRMWSSLGTAFHALMEKESPNTFVEEKFEKKIGKYSVTGRVDCYDMAEGVIYDYKTTSTWKVIYKDFEDWHTQGMIYAYLMKSCGITVKSCCFIAIMRDWQKTKARIDASYPKSQVFKYEFDVTPEELTKIEKFINDKLAVIEQYETLADDAIPECTEKERWHKDDTYAVMKKGRNSALRVLPTLQDAAEYMKANKGDYIEKREGIDGKCVDYCACCEFCSYFKQKYAKKENAKDAEAVQMA